ncbi:hypothetical protein IWZ00DRAFT_557051 [Phyllosticta capitalensis]|uniref:Uncharacterized protein n=1 Tax=Phyllosticta capitalensis TaxID=121624 RepID=A0ABR1YHS1_9PEZI
MAALPPRPPDTHAHGSFAGGQPPWWPGKDQDRNEDDDSAVKWYQPLFATPHKANLLQVPGRKYACTAAAGFTDIGPDANIHVASHECPQRYHERDTWYKLFGGATPNKRLGKKQLQDELRFETTHKGYRQRDDDDQRGLGGRARSRSPPALRQAHYDQGDVWLSIRNLERDNQALQHDVQDLRKVNRRQGRDLDGAFRDIQLLREEIRVLRQRTADGRQVEK